MKFQLFLSVDINSFTYLCLTYVCNYTTTTCVFLQDFKELISEAKELGLEVNPSKV